MTGLDFLYQGIWGFRNGVVSWFSVSWNRRWRRLKGGVGASKRQPAVRPTYGDGCFVPRPQERDVSFLSTQPHGTRSRTPAKFRNG